MTDPCFICKASSVFYQQYSGRHLCETHLKEDVRIRIRRTIRKQGGLGRSKTLAIMWRGEFRNYLLEVITELVTGRQDIEILILDPDMDWSKSLNNSEHLPSSVRIRIINPFEPDINKIIQTNGGNRLFLPSYLDEEAAQVLSCILTNNLTEFIHPVISELLIIKPFREVPREELLLTCRNNCFPSEENVTPQDDEIRDLLNKLIKNHPSIPFSLIRYADRLADMQKRTGSSLPGSS
jgi:hypothetical protein